MGSLSLWICYDVLSWYWSFMNSDVVYKVNNARYPPGIIGALQYYYKKLLWDKLSLFILYVNNILYTMFINKLCLLKLHYCCSVEEPNSRNKVTVDLSTNMAYEFRIINCLFKVTWSVFSLINSCICIGYHMRGEEISVLGMISYIRHVRRAHLECDNLFIMHIFVLLSALEKSKRVKRFWFLSLL